jgi:NADH-quinone oxidoreductase subunit A
MRTRLAGEFVSPPGAAFQSYYAAVLVADLGDWFPFLVYGLFALAIPASMILMSFLFATRPRRRAPARVIPFESGVSTGPPRQQRFTISFYLTAMLFIVFDIEIVFLYPIAVQLVDIGWFAVAEFAFFIAILVIAYVYVWGKGALDWR